VAGRKPRKSAVQLKIRPALRLHQVNDGSHLAGIESDEGEVGAAQIVAVWLETPGRECC
jgi:hypothetical protein